MQVLTFSRPEDLMEQSRRMEPNLIIADLMLADRKTGLETLLNIKEYCNKSKCILISSTKEDQIQELCQNNDIQGYVYKSESIKGIIHAVEEVLGGGNYYSQSTPTEEIQVVRIQEKVNPFSRLTKRELEVVSHLAQGMSYAEIAEAMSISPRTVNNHRVNITDKIGKMSIRHLAMKAKIWGVVQESNVYTSLEKKNSHTYHQPLN